VGGLCPITVPTELYLKGCFCGTRDATVDGVLVVIQPTRKGLDSWGRKVLTQKG